MELQAGAAIGEINPLGNVALYGYPHVPRISTGVHDDLLASVLVLRDGAETVVLAALDLLMIEPPFARELRRSVAEAVGCREACVLISCTHTHSGPVTSRLVGWSADPTIPAPDASYLERVRVQLCDAARQAVDALCPAELVWTNADATGVGGNRLADDGVTDPACGLLAIRSRSDHQPLAAVLIYGMHPTILHEDSTLVSADFPYYARRHLQEHLGARIPVLYHTAPAGNQSPRRFVNGQTFAEAERLGRKLGAAVASAWDQCAPADWCPEVRLGGLLHGITLPQRKMGALAEAEQLLEAYRSRYEQLVREGAPRVEVRTAECSVFGAEGMLALARAAADGTLDARLRDYTPVDVQALRIGQTAVIGLPGELFTEYSLMLKRRAAVPTYAISLVNGELQGYIVTPQAARAGGYEATNAVFAPEAGDLLVEAACALVQTLFGE